MKKVLLGTSAIVAAGLLSTGAMAQDGFSVSVSGTYGFSAAIIDQDDGVGQPGLNTRDHAFGQASEVHFAANQTLDNGTRVRVQVELEGEPIGDQTDEVFIRFSNDAWGTIEMGQRDGPAQKMVTLGPAVSFDHIVGCAQFGHNSGGGGNAVGGLCSLGRLSDSLKVSYFTPVINGIRAGVSYEPDGGKDGTAGANAGLVQGGGPGIDNNTTAGQQGAAIEAGLEYVNTFGDVSFRGSIVYARSEQEGTAAVGAMLDDVDLFNIGAQVGFGAFTIGGHFQGAEVNQNTPGVANGDDDSFRIGVTYSAGPWLVGGAYAQREIEDRVSAGPSINGDDKLTIWGLTARRTLGPGLSVAAGLRFWEWEDDDSLVGNENDANHFFVTAKANF